MPSRPRILLTGATGYVGGRLLPVLLDEGHDVRCLVRNPGKADLDPRAEIVQGDLLDPDGLEDALRGVDVAYYLVHSMGAGAEDFAERDRRAARAFGRAAKDARVIYLGGLEGANGHVSEHLQSREEVADILAEHARETIHVRAAMVVGAGSASFQMLQSLAKRLPLMITPRWIDTRSQPIAIRDVVRTLAALATRDDAPPEIQLGGADVLTYREMIERTARAVGHRSPVVIRTPVLSPRLSSYWVALVTPVDLGLARPLVEGLASEMIVTEPPPPGLNDEPLSFDAAVRAAIQA